MQWLKAAIAEASEVLEELEKGSLVGIRRVEPADHTTAARVGRSKRTSPR